MIRDHLQAYHSEHPHKEGIQASELTGAIADSWIPVEVVEAALKKMINSGTIKLNRNFYSLSAFTMQVSKDTDQAISEILALVSAARFSPPDPEQIASELQMPLDEIKSLVVMLARDKKLIHISQQFYLHADVFSELVEYLSAYFQKQTEMKVVDLKDFIQTTRKFAIPLFEYLDSETYTLRDGDVRRRGPALS